MGFNLANRTHMFGGRSLKCTFIVFIFQFLLIPMSYGTNNGKNPIALQLQVIDSISGFAKEAVFTEAVFNQLLPEIKVKTIVTQSGLFFTRSKKLRKKLVEQINSQLGPNDRIEYLVLSTHGNTLVNKKDKRPYTKLKYFGDFYENSISNELKSILEPISLQTSPSLNVLLNSCSTFCGGTDSAAKRAQSLLSFLNAPNGSIYGADVPEVSMVLSSREYSNWRHVIPGWRSYLTATALLAAIVDLTASSAFSLGVWASSPPGTLDPLMVFEFAKTLGPFSLKVGAVASATLYTIANLLHIAGPYILNKGHFFEFKNGVLDVAKPMVKRKHLKSFLLGTFGKTCGKLFKSK